MFILFHLFLCLTSWFLPCFVSPSFLVAFLSSLSPFSHSSVFPFVVLQAKPSNPTEQSKENPKPTRVWVCSQKTRQLRNARQRRRRQDNIAHQRIGNEQHNTRQDPLWKHLVLFQKKSALRGYICFSSKAPPPWLRHGGPPRFFSNPSFPQKEKSVERTVSKKTAPIARFT